MKSLRLAWSGAMLGFALATISSVQAKEYNPPPMLDANFSVAWWRTIDKDERYGFEFGTQQCLSHHLRVGVDLAPTSDEQMDRIDKAVSKNGPADASVGKIIEGVLKGSGKDPSVLDYETAWGPWPESAKRGLVEGYITCRERHGKNTWRNPAQYYVDVLNLLYNSDLTYGRDTYGGLVSDILDKYGFPYQPSATEDRKSR